MTVKISDENDNKPVFAIENYEVSISDKTAVGSIILETSALDADEGTNAKIEYSLVQDSNEFSIPDKTSGKISIKASLVGKTNTYNFRVRASNPSTTFSSTVNVKVEVKDSDPPRFSRTTYHTTISEGRKAGFEIMSLSISATSQSKLPNAKVVYSLPKGTMPETNENAFAIDSETGRLKVAGELNYETIKNYIVYVQAKDMSNSMVSNAIVRIGVLDENDNAPLFHLPKYEYVTVTEGQSAGVVVGQVYASDRDSTTNAQLRYSLSRDSRHFKINENTGQLTTNKTFDRELTEKVTIHVTAKDMGKPQQENNVFVSVTIIDLNDNPPIFTKSLFSGSVKESSAIGFRFLKIEATDLDAGDNAKVKFYITGGNADGYFTMSSSTFVKDDTVGGKSSRIKSSAWITVAKPLDRETKDTFRLTITATDSRYSRTAIAEVKVCHLKLQ